MGNTANSVPIHDPHSPHTIDRQDQPKAFPPSSSSLYSASAAIHNHALHRTTHFADTAFLEELIDDHERAMRERENYSDSSDHDDDDRKQPLIEYSTSMMNEVMEEAQPGPADTDDDLSFVPDGNVLDDVSTVFQEERTLGKGASGFVLKVRHKTNGHCFALKKIHKNQQSNLKSFKNERQILRKALHSNIVRYHSCYVDRDHYCIVTEYCHGGTMLNKVLKMTNFTEQKAA